MNLLGVRAFATELLKIALELQDADVRALFAERRGEKDYLPGGQLLSNAPAETNFLPKLASKRRTGLDSTNPLATHLDRLRSNTKKPGGYQEARDTALTGLGGALTGASVLRLTEKMRRSQATASPRGYMAAAGVGAAAGLADRVYRHYRPSSAPAPAGSAATKLAMPLGPVGGHGATPGMKLESSGRVGKFMGGVHAAPHTAGLIGKAGRLPHV
jgi:hypothetical protein